MNSLLKTYKMYDPAAKSQVEIFFLYPGFRAILLHRIAHLFFKRNIWFIPRMISEFSRFMNGIDIHPGALLGKNIVIDHGLGLVIGETAVVGDSVILYQGVTLGGTKLHRGKRHPTLEDHVVVGAGAKILGNVVIGKQSRIGANSVVIQDVPQYSTVVGIPAKLLPKGIDSGEELHHDFII